MVTWHNECPYPDCVCHSTYLKNLPVFSIMHITKTHTKPKHNIAEELSKLHDNEVLYYNILSHACVCDWACAHVQGVYY